MNDKTSSEKMREHLRLALDIAIAQEEKTYRTSFEKIDDNIIKTTKLMNPIKEALTLLKQEFADNERIYINPNNAVLNLKVHGKVRNIIEIGTNPKGTAYTIFEQDFDYGAAEMVDYTSEIPTTTEVLAKIIKLIAQHVALDNVIKERTKTPHDKSDENKKEGL